MSSVELLTRKTARGLRCIPAMPTAFKASKLGYEAGGLSNEDAPIWWDEEEKLIRFLLQGDVDAVLWAGTTGEAATMVHIEQGFGTRKVVELVNGAVPVIAGAGSNCTAEAMELAKNAMEMGASAVLLVMPYYNKPTPAGQLAHFEMIATLGMPIILYSVPSRTGRDIDLQVVATMAHKWPNILGIKEAGDFKRFGQIRRCCPEDFIIWSGNDEATCQAMTEGNCDGVITVAGNVVPASIKEMVDLLVSGQHSQAAAINRQIEKLIAALFIESNPIPVKKALELMGVIEKAHYRLPMTHLETRNLDVLRGALAELKLLPVTA